jgi:hypothetical protein
MLLQQSMDDSQVTIPYDDEHSREELFAETWIAYDRSQSKLPKMVRQSKESFDYMSHAIHDARRVLLDTYSVLPWTKEDAECLFTIPGPWNEPRCFYYDFRLDTCFSVTRDEILTEADVAKYFHLVEAADRKEIESFVEHEVFE